MRNDVKQIRMHSEDPDVSFLAATNRQTGMSVPTGFFDAFEAKMEQVIDHAASQEHTVEIKADGEGTHRYRWMAVAASLLFVVALWPVWRGLQEVRQPAEISTVNALANVGADVAGEVTDMSVGDVAEDVIYASLSDYEMYDLYCEATL